MSATDANLTQPDPNQLVLKTPPFRRFFEGFFEAISKVVAQKSLEQIEEELSKEFHWLHWKMAGEKTVDTPRRHTPLELNGDAHIKGDISIRLMD